MSITTVKAFIATCDGCGQEFEDDGEEYTYVFMSREEIESTLNDCDWLVKGKKCYCPDCKEGKE